jgi:hypothetical protein
MTKQLKNKFLERIRIKLIVLNNFLVKLLELKIYSKSYIKLIR